MKASIFCLPSVGPDCGAHQKAADAHKGKAGRRQLGHTSPVRVGWGTLLAIVLKCVRRRADTGRELSREGPQWNRSR
jgi:hypothetical protein